MTQSLGYGLADADAQTTTDRLNSGLQELSNAAGRLAPLQQHWSGTQPAAFLSTQAAEAIDTQITRLGVNFPRLAVQSLAERIRLAGIADSMESRPLADEQAAEQVWQALVSAGLHESAGIVTSDRLLYGSSYLTVWATELGGLTVTADSPLMMVHAPDPATGDTDYAVRGWTQLHYPDIGVQSAHAVLYERDRITRYIQPGSGAPTPGPSWRIEQVIDNPLGVVPVVPFVRRVSASDLYGQSSVDQILDLTDAVSKLLSDALVTSEYEARPRRWATGLEIVEDAEGNPIDPFGPSRFLQSEAPDTKFGQLDAARLDGYVQLVGTITQLIGALTALPPNYLGVMSNHPPSADAVKATEIQLTTAAYTEQDRMTRPWSDVAWLAAAVITGRPCDPKQRGRYRPVWESPEIRTQAQASDAAAKLAGIGVPLESLLADPLGYAPDAIAEVMAARQSVAPSSPAIGGNGLPTNGALAL